MRIPWLHEKHRKINALSAATTEQQKCSKTSSCPVFSFHFSDKEDEASYHCSFTFTFLLLRNRDDFCISHRLFPVPSSFCSKLFLALELNESYLRKSKIILNLVLGVKKSVTRIVRNQRENMGAKSVCVR